MDGVRVDVAPAQRQDFAAAATGESEQADGGDGLGPSGLMPVEFVRVEEAGDLVPEVLADAETGIGAARAPAPLLGVEHHRAPDLERPVGRAGALAAGSIEPGGHVLAADPVQGHAAEGREDTPPEVDAHGFAPRRLPAGFAAAQVLPGEVVDGRSGPGPADVVDGVVAGADVLQDRAGAAPRLGQCHLAVAGDDDAARASLDARLHDPDLAPGGVDAKAEAGQALVEQEQIALGGPAVSGEPWGEINGGRGGSLRFRPGRPVSCPRTRSAASDTERSDRWT